MVDYRMVRSFCKKAQRSIFRSRFASILHLGCYIPHDCKLFQAISFNKFLVVGFSKRVYCLFGRILAVLSNFGNPD